MNRNDVDTAIGRLTASRKAYVVATVVRTEAPTSAKAGDRAVLDGDGIVAGWVGGGCAQPAVTRNAADALRDGRTRLIRISRNLDGLETGIMGYPMTCHSGGTLDIFIEPVMPKSSLVVIGHTAIAQALCELGSGAGFAVIVAAPGGDREKFPSASGWLEEFDNVADLESVPEAIVVATQGSGDARGLEAALATGSTYVGLIASPKKSARLKETLKKRGHNADTVDAIDAPAGLYIGARTPSEVAISVLAELVQRRRVGNRAMKASHDGSANESTAKCCTPRGSAATDME